MSKNLSKKGLKKLGITEGEVNQYKKEGLLDLALKIATSRGFLIEKAEFLKGNEEDKKLYHPNIHEAVKLIREMKEMDDCDVGKVKGELEKKIEEQEKRRLKFKGR